MQDKHTKKTNKTMQHFMSFISSKQNFMSFISDNFVSNTGQDLIQNSNHLRYHNELKRKQVQLH